MAKDPKSSEPFVSQQDRPAVGADTPVSELRVRDLHAILSNAAHNALFKAHKDKDLEKIHKDFDKTHPDKPHKEVFETQIHAKHIEKQHLEKFQPEKVHPDKIQPDKLQKEFKEIDKHTKEATKDALDQFKNIPELPPDPTTIGGDPAAQISQLQATVDQLTSEVAELKAKTGK
ncbi:hypothetical protein UP10_21940 [Bradyrhizobium sp. LTSPM299]|jgi:creatinine amidohydrolase/Fe(II)-dependent formamide hydrolase-like protein|uniref:hypothetical protein n=1 Tax=Bradyrhizobium sp. LTSPM299 TaxID=1619233 RepID=UPI0005CA291F|nr:hypothetical protein [Bradyrhizobium sp. LTSPM299]KJC58737.1 hypothetical protein UP10_21940 [Bradyrhizobium sp. LTSPM299]